MMNRIFGKFIVLLLEDFQKKEKAIQSEINNNESVLFQKVTQTLTKQYVSKKIALDLKFGVFDAPYKVGVTFTFLGKHISVWVALFSSSS